MTLHILNQSQQLDHCLALVRGGDCILLIEAGVRAVTSLCEDTKGIAVTKTVPIYALRDDLEQSGLKVADNSGVMVIGWGEIVDLCCQHSPILSW